MAGVGLVCFGGATPSPRQGVHAGGQLINNTKFVAHTTSSWHCNSGKTMQPDDADDVAAAAAVFQFVRRRIK